MPQITKIISGGQTGVDRAALDFAIGRTIPCGGFCPRDRLADDGVIPERYPLQEISGGFRVRTEKNVQSSDGTLILNLGELQGGSLLTRNLCLKHSKPHLVIDIECDHAIITTRNWLSSIEMNVLNIAGPGEKRIPGIYRSARTFLRMVFANGNPV